MPFIFSRLPEEQQLPHLTWKDLFLPKNNFSFKCPLHRGWNNLSSTLWRQKKVIAWVSHYLQQGKRQRSHYRSSWSSNGTFPACHFCKREAQFICGNLWAPHIWIINTSHAGWAVIRYNLVILILQVFGGWGVGWGVPSCKCWEHWDFLLIWTTHFLRSSANIAQGQVHSISFCFQYG